MKLTNTCITLALLALSLYTTCASAVVETHSTKCGEFKGTFKIYGDESVSPNPPFDFAKKIIASPATTKDVLEFVKAEYENKYAPLPLPQKKYFLWVCLEEGTAFLRDSGAADYNNENGDNSKDVTEFFHADLDTGKYDDEDPLSIYPRIYGGKLRSDTQEEKSKQYLFITAKIKGVLNGGTDIKLQGLAQENYKALPKTDNTHQKVIASLNAGVSGGGELGLIEDNISVNVLMKGNFAIKTNGIFAP